MLLTPIRSTIKVMNRRIPGMISVLLMALLPSHAPVIARAVPATSDEVVERGRFRFFDTKQPVGEETYEITRESGEIVLKSQLKLEADKPVALSATLVM